MEEIIDIYVYDPCFDGMYDLDNSFYGRVLKTDSSIEGIVKEYNGSKCYIVYGTLEEDHISFMHSSSEEILSHRYVAEKIGNTFDGTCFATDGTIDIPIGECQIKTIPAEKSRETTSFEIEGIRSRVKKYQETLSPDNKKQYALWKLQQKNKQMIKK